MKIVGITACPTGIAHTYITRKKILEAAKELGHECTIETQGTIGVENQLLKEDIESCDVVILAVDVKISGEERFRGKPIVRVRTTEALKNPKGLLESIEKKLKEKANNV